MTQELIIVLTVVGSLLGVAAIFFLVYFIFLSNHRLKKQVTELHEAYERRHGILFGEDSQYIKRLETIADYNLIYAQTLSTWQKRYDEIKEIGDSTTKNAVDTMEWYIEEKKWKDLKDYLPQGRKLVNDYCARVDELDEGLKNKFKEEEEVRVLLTSKREKCRNARATFLGNKDDLALVSDSFETLFHKVNGLFDEVENHIQNARYHEAKIVLTEKIDPILTTVIQVNKNLPATCLELTQILPDKILSLSSHYDTMLDAGYPLSHILTRQDLENLSLRVKNLSLQASALELKGVNEGIAQIEEYVASANASLEKEESSRKEFEGNFARIYEEEAVLENDFIELCHSLPNVRKIYLFEEQQDKDLELIQAQINRASTAKRLLDNYVHNTVKQPYSLLLEKMEILDEHRTYGQKAIDDFRAYIVSLKHDSEAAGKLVSDTFSGLKNAESSLRAINVPSYEKSYRDKINAAYEAVDVLYNTLKTLPIDVRNVNAMADNLKEKTAYLFKEIYEGTESAKKAEKALIYANRYRNFGPSNNALLQAETLFNDGRFNECYQLVSETIEERSSI